MIYCNSVSEGIIKIPSLSIPEGFTAVVGNNGCGKTTLLELIAGIRVPGQGSIVIDGVSPRSLDVGWMDETPDDNILFFSVFDEIASPLVFKNVPCEEIRLKVLSIAGKLSLQHLLNRDTSTLSGGEKVLVAIAAILVTGPDLVVLDEFDSSLDKETVLNVVEVLVYKRPKYLIICTHSKELAKKADFVIQIEGGSLKRYGTPEEVLEI